MSRLGGLECRDGCSLLHSASSSSSATFLQQRIYHLCHLASTKVFCSAFSAVIFLHPSYYTQKVYFSLPSPSVLLERKCVHCTGPLKWWGLTGSISSSQIRVYLLTACISLPQNATLHVILVVSVKVPLKISPGLVIDVLTWNTLFKEG